MSTPKFAHSDTKLADGVYARWERQTLDDPDASPLDYLFQDEDYREQDQERLDAYNADRWCFIGIRAVAHVTIVKNHTGFSFTLESAGLWGIESDSDASYFDDVFEQEKSELIGWTEGFDLSTATVL